ncbi:hypothetical protein LEP1GSC049_2857 [Leptospira kirschneri serovar Cynopteri str. 3522 CT]|nr:hypothetical protein LEP1GSC049_2857 [Leptospira kirschneri serovar Cynopteri str. 3522 CT]
MINKKTSLRAAHLSFQINVKVRLYVYYSELYNKVPDLLHFSSVKFRERKPGRIRHCRTALSAPINKLRVCLKTKSFPEFNLLIPPQSLSHLLCPAHVKIRPIMRLHFLIFYTNSELVYSNILLF